MKFLADMGISMTTVQWLRNNNHDVIHVRERNMQRASDSQILREAYREERIVLTMDLDFGHLVAISREKLPSVIIFRLGDERPNNIDNRLGDVLQESSDALINGAIISVTEDKHRVRLLPISDS